MFFAKLLHLQLNKYYVCLYTFHILTVTFEASAILYFTNHITVIVWQSL